MTMPAQTQKSKSAGENLPDISLLRKSEFASTLSQVGMGKIEMPILFTVADAQPILLPALVDAFVSLDNPETKGIHMSRLYLELKNHLQLKPVTLTSMKEILKKFILSHEGLSESAFLELRFNVPLERKALISGERGYRQYPLILKARYQNQKYDFIMVTEVLYSSTCPCSAALARQLVEQAFSERFSGKENLKKEDVLNWLKSEESAVAFPHAQRSLARFEVRLKELPFGPSFLELIDRAETALGTPVQAAVKRVDEQEFARLNASNLMFCEDAARKLRGALEEDDRILDYHIYVEHQESLHPHDAISRVVKGVPGGFSV